MSDAVRTGAPRHQGSTRLERPRLMVRWPVVVWATAAVPFAVSVEPLPLEAKAPGVSHCYRRVCHHVKTVEQTRRMIGRTFVVETSFYDLPGLDRYNTGIYTSNGERFDANDPARVASADLPDGTELLLRNPVNGRVSHVRVNDFGPFRGNRRLDVTRRVAEDLDFRHKGVVRLDVIVIAAPEEDDLTYRRNRERRATRGHLGVVFEGEMPGLVSSLVTERNPAVEPPAVVASLEPPPAATPGMETASQAEKPADRPPDRTGEARFERVVFRDAPAPSNEPEPSIEQASEAEPSAETEAAVVLFADATEVVDAEVDTEVHAALPDTRQPGNRSPFPADSGPGVVARLDQPEAPQAGAPGIEAEHTADPPAPSASPSRMQVAGFVSTAEAASDTGGAARAISANRNLILVLLAGLLSALLAASIAQHRRFARKAFPRLTGTAPSPRQSSLIARSAGDALPSAAAVARPAAPVPSTEAAVTVRVPRSQPATVPPDRALSRIAAHLEIEGTLRSSGRIEVSGKVKGRIEADEVIVLPGGSIEGDAICRVADIAGTLTGAVSAHQVLVRAKGRVDATIETAFITVDASGCLEGHVRRRIAAPKGDISTSHHVNT